MRAFVAIDLPPIEGEIPNWLRPEDHLTLHFFEELDFEQIPTVVEAMVEAAALFLPFGIEVRGVGAFPSAQRPRVIWAGLGEGSAAVISIVERMRKALSSRGFATENRPFIPHLTLARVRSARGTAWAGQFLTDPVNASRTWTRSTVTELLLKESELLPTGPRHTVRERVPLGP